MGILWWFQREKTPETGGRDRVETKQSWYSEAKKSMVAVENVCPRLFKHTTWFISWTWDLSQQSWMFAHQRWLSYWINHRRILGKPCMILEEWFRRLKLLLPFAHVWTSPWFLGGIVTNLSFRNLGSHGFGPRPCPFLISRLRIVPLIPQEIVHT